MTSSSSSSNGLSQELRPLVANEQLQQQQHMQLSSSKQESTANTCRHLRFKHICSGPHQEGSSHVSDDQHRSTRRCGVLLSKSKSKVQQQQQCGNVCSSQAGYWECADCASAFICAECDDSEGSLTANQEHLLVPFTTPQTIGNSDERAIGVFCYSCSKDLSRRSNNGSDDTKVSSSVRCIHPDCKDFALCGECKDILKVERTSSSSIIFGRVSMFEQQQPQSPLKLKEKIYVPKSLDDIAEKSLAFELPQLLQLRVPRCVAVTLGGALSSSGAAADAEEDAENEGGIPGSSTAAENKSCTNSWRRLTHIKAKIWFWIRVLILMVPIAELLQTGLKVTEVPDRARINSCVLYDANSQQVARGEYLSRKKCDVAIQQAIGGGATAGYVALRKTLGVADGNARSQCQVALAVLAAVSALICFAWLSILTFRQYLAVNLLSFGVLLTNDDSELEARLAMSQNNNDGGDAAKLSSSPSKLWRSRRDNLDVVSITTGVLTLLGASVLYFLVAVPFVLDLPVHIEGFIPGKGFRCSSSGAGSTICQQYNATFVKPVFYTDNSVCDVLPKQYWLSSSSGEPGCVRAPTANTVWPVVATWLFTLIPLILVFWNLLNSPHGSLNLANSVFELKSRKFPDLLVNKMRYAVSHSALMEAWLMWLSSSSSSSSSDDDDGDDAADDDNNTTAVACGGGGGGVPRSRHERRVARFIDDNAQELFDSMVPSSSSRRSATTTQQQQQQQRDDEEFFSGASFPTGWCCHPPESSTRRLASEPFPVGCCARSLANGLLRFVFCGFNWTAESFTSILVSHFSVKWEQDSWRDRVYIATVLYLCAARGKLFRIAGPHRLAPSLSCTAEVAQDAASGHRRERRSQSMVMQQMRAPPHTAATCDHHGEQQESAAVSVEHGEGARVTGVGRNVAYAAPEVPS